MSEMKDPTVYVKVNCLIVGDSDLSILTVEMKATDDFVELTSADRFLSLTLQLTQEARQSNLLDHVRRESVNIYVVYFSEGVEVSCCKDGMLTLADFRNEEQRLRAAVFVGMEDGDSFTLYGAQEEVVAKFSIVDGRTDIFLAPVSREVGPSLSAEAEPLYQMEMLEVSSEEPSDVTLVCIDDKFYLEGLSSTAIDTYYSEDEFFDVICDSERYVYVLFFQNGCGSAVDWFDQVIDAHHRIIAWSQDRKLIMVAATHNSVCEYQDADGKLYQVLVDDESSWIVQND